MLTIKCPSCGAPAPVALASPDAMRCPTCGYVGPVPVEAAGRLRAGMAMLGTIDARERQLTANQRRSLVSSGAYGFAFVALVLVIAAPILAVLAAIVIIAIYLDGRLNFVLLAVGIAPLLALSGCAALGLWRISSRRKALQLACAANPPVGVGDSARCHLCGAPLAQTQGAGLVVRCPYCEADNLVDPAVLARLGKERWQGLDELDQRLGHRARSLKATTAWASVGTLLAITMAPLFSLGAAVTAAAVLRALELAPDDSILYRYRGMCLAEASAVAPSGQVRARDLVGKQLRHRFFHVSTVKAVYRDPVYNKNYVRSRGPRGTVRAPVHGSCLARDADGVALAHVGGMLRPILTVHDGTAYFVNGQGPSKLLAVPLAGGTTSQIARNEHNILDVAVDDGRVLYTTHKGLHVRGRGLIERGAVEVEVGDGAIYGATHKQIVLVAPSGGRPLAEERHPRGLLYHGGELYWLDMEPFRAGERYGAANLRAMPASGGTPRTLAEGIRPRSRTRLAADDHFVYWINDEGPVSRVPRRGGPAQTVIHATHAISDLALDGSRIFWITGAGINMRPMSGGNRTLIEPTASRAEWLAVAAGWLLWVDAGSNEIVRLPLSGLRGRPAP